MELEHEAHHYILKLGNILRETVEIEAGTHKTLTLYDKHGGLASKEFNCIKNIGVTMMTSRQLKMGVENIPVILYISHMPMPRQLTTA